MLKFSQEQYIARVAEYKKSVFYRSATEQDAMNRYNRMFANPRFDRDELFVFEIDTDEPWNFIVQTTGSLVKAGA